MGALGRHWTRSPRSRSPHGASRSAKTMGPPTPAYTEPRTGLDTLHPDDGSTWLTHRRRCILTSGQCRGMSPSQPCHSATHCPSWRPSTVVTNQSLCPDKDILWNTTKSWGHMTLVHRPSTCKNWWKLSKVWATALFSMARFSLKTCFSKSYFSSKRKEKKGWVRCAVW